MTVHIRGDSAVAGRSVGGPLDHLRVLIRAVPVPTAPLTFPSREAALGLALMDLSFRLDHVPRPSEHLTLVDRGHMSREISVDVDVDLISGRLRDTLLVPGDPAPGPGGVAVGAGVRYSRRDLAPAVIRDARGEVVPRLSHRDANRVIAAAFVKLLLMLINAHDDVSAPASPIHQLRHPPAVAVADRGGDHRAHHGRVAVRAAVAHPTRSCGAARASGQLGDGIWLFRVLTPCSRPRAGIGC
jgi:hypothetical protein